MEKTVMILEQFPLKEREYTNSKGEKKVIASKGLVISDGWDSMYCEVVGNSAREMGELNEGILYKVSLQSRVRSWKAQNGEVVFVTDVRMIGWASQDGERIRKEVFG